LYLSLAWYQTQEVEVGLQPDLVPADYNHWQHKEVAELVVHSLDLEEDRVIVVEEGVKLQVVGAELHKAQSDQKHSLDQAERAQIHQAFEL